MSNAFILSMVAVFISLAVVLIGARKAASRTTQIETRRDVDVDDEPGAN